jgi:putative ABC transport system substrate-binding protein
MHFHQWKRREFMALVGSAAAAWPLAARAQQPERMRRIGVLMPAAADDADARDRLRPFQQGLQQLGWNDGHNIRIDYRWGTSDAETIYKNAADLIALAPDVILANGTPALKALRQETRTIPIVFVQVTDPVAQGIVSSLTHPGGNITGFSAYEFSIGGKWLELLKEVAPRIVRVKLLFNPKTAPYANYYLRSFEAAASSFAAEAIPTPVQDASELERAIMTLAAEPNAGLIAMPDVFTTAHRDLIISLAARHHIPGVYPLRVFAENGGLLSYGIEPTDAFRRAATYVDRILRGAKPAELPVQLPSKYTLIINLKTAKALGLTVPLIMQMTADEVIE